MTHLFQKNIIRMGVNSAGINQGKPMSQPFTVRIDPVTRHAGGVLDNRDAMSADPVKKSRFANVRPSDDRNKGFCHNMLFLRSAQGIKQISAVIGDGDHRNTQTFL